jgi:hypothetical protein
VVRSCAPLVFGRMLGEIESPATGATVTSIGMKSDFVGMSPLVHKALPALSV